MKLQKDPHVAVSYFGEGATSEGDFHAGVNFAAVLKCPAIFFCRNNGYAISTSTSHQYASEGVAPKGVGYGVTTYRIDGNDFFAVYDTVKTARQLCIEGKGPILIEALTYRLGAHSTADDPSIYRTQEEVKQWEKKDPLRRLKKYLEMQNVWNDGKENEEMQAISKSIDDAITKAKATPRPALHTMIEDVYETVPESLKEQYEELKTLFPQE
jgi:2-oxoisovalerate dehydrogenase E1 component alpha subunit